MSSSTRRLTRLTQRLGAQAPGAIVGPQMLQALLVTFREGIEAFLIVGVVARTSRRAAPASCAA